MCQLGRHGCQAALATHFRECGYADGGYICKNAISNFCIFEIDTERCRICISLGEKIETAPQLPLFANLDPGNNQLAKSFTIDYLLELYGGKFADYVGVITAAQYVFWTVGDPVKYVVMFIVIIENSIFLF